MKRRMNLVSLNNWPAIKKELTDRQAGVVAGFHELGGSANLFELCELFGCLPNDISGRLTELNDYGVIEPVGRDRVFYKGKFRNCNRYKTVYHKNGKKRAA